MTLKKICVLGLGPAGVPLGAVIAYKCPEIRVTIIKTNTEDTFQWNTNNLPPSLSGLDDFLRKCQNKNLVFSTNEALAVKESDIIFVVTDSRCKSYGEGANEALDLSAIEEAAYLIAEHADTNKIVVENSCIPLKSAECMSNVFKHNSKPDVELEVLSNPGFYENGGSMRNLVFPDCVLIGSENTPKGLAAAKKLSSIYQRWVPAQNIITRTNWSVELSKIATSAMAAQELGSLFTISTICEEAGGDVTSVIRLLSKNKGTGTGYLDLNPNVGKYPVVLHNLVYMCEFMELWEAAEYWRQVLKIFDVHQERLLKKLICVLTSDWNKRVVVLGYTCYSDTQSTEGSSVVEVCKLFLEENATVIICDTRVTENQVIGDLKSSGCNVPDERLKTSLAVVEDFKTAAKTSQVFLVCASSPRFADLPFEKVFQDVKKPAFIFDWGRSLPLDRLAEIGFQVHAVGRSRKT